MQNKVDRQRIELFLQRLGRLFTKSGRLYLVGGTTMVYEGLRQQTLDSEALFFGMPKLSIIRVSYHQVTTSTVPPLSAHNRQSAI